MSDGTLILALFAGIGDLFLDLTLKKPSENQCFWFRTLKNLRKINAFALPKHLATLESPLGPPRPKNYISQTPDPPPKRPLCYFMYDFAKHLRFRLFFPKFLNRF